MRLGRRGSLLRGLAGEDVRWDAGFVFGVGGGFYLPVALELVPLDSARCFLHDDFYFIRRHSEARLCGVNGGVKRLDGVVVFGRGAGDGERDGQRVLIKVDSHIVLRRSLGEDVDRDSLVVLIPVILDFVCGCGSNGLRGSCWCRGCRRRFALGGRFCAGYLDIGNLLHCDLSALVALGDFLQLLCDLGTPYRQRFLLVV
jgi:hypothetical protein